MGLKPHQDKRLVRIAAYEDKGFTTDKARMVRKRTCTDFMIVLTPISIADYRSTA
jgi:hypothetical protein